jgi:RNA polymerase sigma-70 factor (ECF subfamily)
LSPYQIRHAFDSEYIDRLVAEDPTTERHFTKYFGELLSLKLRGRLSSPALVEDARQETFVRVLTTLKQRGGLQRPETLGAFVNSVCNNVLFEMYRSGKKTIPVDDEAPEPADDESPDAEAALMREQDCARLRRALQALPQKDQDLLRWLFLEERDKDDVCRRLQIDRGYLRVLLFRAKLKLREQLDAMDVRAPE